jgi:hypothetical protein
MTDSTQLFPHITLLTTESKLYRVRTEINASEADATIYFHDPRHGDSSGAQLTAKHSERFIPIALPAGSVDDAVGKIYAAIASIPLPVVNIAGNAIYRFPVDRSQESINEQIVDIIDLLHKKKKIGIVRSGGQTGADWGGLVAAAVLNIPCTSVFPADFRMRNRARKDIQHTEQEIRQMLKDSVDNLMRLEL